MAKKIVKGMWAAFGVVIFSLMLFVVLVYHGVIGYMPDIEELQNPIDKYASQVISSNGELIGTLSYSKNNRVFVSYQDLPQNLVNALVATEDERFFEHSGIDFRALSRAIFKRGIMGQKNAGGGSTITQQLVKQLYSEHVSTVFERLMQKPIEWIISIKLERYYTKEEIITLYLNYFDFLHNSVGIKTAANTYFGKEPKDLNLNECATLVGMLKNPSYFNPRRDKTRAENRRNTVLGQMLKSHYLTQAEVDECSAQPIELADTRTAEYKLMNQQTGCGQYYKEYLRVIMTAKKPNRKDYASWQDQKFYQDSLAWELDPLYGWCNKNINKKTGKPFDVYQDGLKIYASMDTRMQRYAEDAMKKHVVGNLQPIFDRERKGSPNAPYNYNMKKEDVERALARAKRQSGRYIEMKRSGCSESEIEKAFSTPIEMTVYSPHDDNGIDTVMSPMDSIKYYKKFLRSGFVCIENSTGLVKAYVGGTDFNYFKYDMASQGRRQVGSTIKPYLYSIAMESGYTPCSKVPCSPHVYHYNGSSFSPRGNYSGFGDNTPLWWGLQTSNNWISAYLIDALTPPVLVDYIHKFGVRNRKIEALLPLCLGSCEISVLEMVAAYTTFPKGGTRCQPVFVTRIVDSDGDEVANLQSLQVKKDPHDDLDTREVLSQEAAYRMIYMMRKVVEAGTGSRMRGYGVRVDMGGKTGTTNDNTDGWFLGYTPSLTFGAWVGGEERAIHFVNGGIGQGAASALPVCAYFLQKVYAADSGLGYSSSEKFDVPDGFDFCGGEEEIEEDDWDFSGGADENGEDASSADEEVENAVVRDLLGV